MLNLECPICGNVLEPVTTNRDISCDRTCQKWYCLGCDLAITTDEPSNFNLVDFLYEDTDTGERIFVEIDRSKYDTIEDALTAADEVADTIFSDWDYIDMFTYDEAVELGYDTY